MVEQIGPYRIDSRIGMGGMGVVYAAHDEALHRRVALKVISPQLADDDEFRTRFIREARAMASLESPNVVAVYAHGETDGQLWIATQYFPDGDLGTLMRRSGPPSLLVVLEIITQVADGLATAHAAGLVHRDIKPANVLLRRNGLGWSAALADFGIARAGNDQTGLTQGGMVGTPSFMAPELHRGAAAGPASDVYSMGCLLWATLTGTAPYGGTTDYEVVTAHLEQPVPQLEGDTGLILGINRVLQRAMAKDPGARQATAAELRDELRTLVAEAATGATVVRRDSDLPAVRPAAAGGSPVGIAGAHAGAAAPPYGEATSSARQAGGRTWTRYVLIGVAVLACVVGAVLWSGILSPEEANKTSLPPTSTGSSTPTQTPTESSTETPTQTPTESSTESPTESPTETTSPEADSAGYTEADRRKATRSMVKALLTQPMIDRSIATCTAQTILEGEGLAQMVDAGFFDESWTYVDQDLEPYPELKQRFTSATFGCVAG